MTQEHNERLSQTLLFSDQYADDTLLFIYIVCFIVSWLK